MNLRDSIFPGQALTLSKGILYCVSLCQLIRSLHQL